MRKSMGLLLVSCLWLQIPCEAQQVVRVNRPYILVDVASKDNVHVGEVYRLYRWVAQTAVVTGKIEALVFRAEHCAFKITQENEKQKIKIGDWLLRPGESLPQTLSGPQEQHAAGRPVATKKSTLHNSPHPRRWITWTAMGAGVVSSGLAYYFWDRADDLARKTGQTSDPEYYNFLASEVRRYDRNSNFCTGLGAGMIAFGVVHYLLTRQAPEIQAGPVAILPMPAAGNPGVGLTFAFK